MSMVNTKDAVIIGVSTVYTFVYAGWEGGQSNVYINIFIKSILIWLLVYWERHETNCRKFLQEPNWQFDTLVFFTAYF